jgi:transcriptional regulator with XRE-family HTH domain
MSEKIDKRTELQKVGERIKALRRNKGYANYEAFAHGKDLNRSQVGRYEKGTDDMRYSSLLAIIKALDMTPAEFFSEGFD